MLFNSYIFTLIFLPATIVGYFTLNRFGRYRTAGVYLLLMSLWFYGYFSVKYLVLIISSVLMNFMFYRLLLPQRSARQRKLLLAVGLVFNLGLLFYYKYYDFFVENVNLIFDKTLTLRYIALPLGISFFTFQQLSFVIDAYRREVPSYGFLDYALFVTYFPQLVAGPIVLHDELVPQFCDMSKRRLSWDNLSRGLFLFSLGLAKKVLLADVFGNAVNWGYANISELDLASGLLVILAYTLQLYLDFSGYCDMALGIGKMMNIELPLNFDAPLRSRTVAEFWNRWHITLSRFFTKYIYIPLGGNRHGAARAYINTMAVFFISGLWHGADWTYVFWGVLHGVFVVLSKAFKKYLDRVPSIINWAFTFCFVCMVFVFFRAESFAQAGQLLSRLAVAPGAVPAEITDCFAPEELTMLFSALFGADPRWLYALLFFAVGMLVALSRRNGKDLMAEFKPDIVHGLATVALLAWSVMSFTAESTFLYFNF